MLPTLPKWLKGWFDTTDLTKDVKLLSFAAVVVFSIMKLWTSPVDANWVNAFYGLCTLVGLGGSMWSAVEKWKAPTPGDKEDAK